MVQQPSNHHHLIVNWEIRHLLPGRCRFYASALQHHGRLAHGVELQLLRTPGVRLVRASTKTGTVLVLFDPATTSPESLLLELRRCHPRREARSPNLEDREVSVLRSTVGVAARWDHALRSATGDRVNLKLLAISVLTAKAGWHALGAGPLSYEAAESLWEAFLAWVLFRHPRLEREVERLESLYSPAP